uniref:Ig-like domain-containing protein n=1 Tax=Chelonoidis abingdonii TaxID=106734 RepID=A0A8C0GZW7_CHEAB
ITVQIGVMSPSESSRMVSPAKPLMVSVGEDALLPCHLSPRMNAEDMEVRWFRSSFPEVIHLYRDGKDQPEQQILEYQGRTELLRDNITEGSVVLRIHSIRPADEGQYSCFFQSSTFYGAALLELKVKIHRLQDWKGPRKVIESIELHRLLPAQYVKDSCIETRN